MNQFAADVAGMLELFAVAAGLVLLHYGRRESAGLLKAAAIVLIAGGILGGLCTGYYWLRYQQQGAFDQAGPSPAMMQQHRQMMMKMMHGQGQMTGERGGMMGSGGSKSGMAGSENSKAESADDDHAEHH